MRGLFRRGRKAHQGFTLVELLIVLAVIGILSTVAYLGISRSQTRNMNAKVLSDLAAIQNALDQYKQDHQGSYPLPTVGQTNLLCFGKNTAYLHDCQNAFFLQSQLTEELLSKRYLPQIPRDPRTGALYAYGVSQDGQSVQVAGTYWDSEKEGWVAKVSSHLADNFPLRSLIRSFNGPDFVHQDGLYLPYHPESFQLTAQLRQADPGVKVLNASGNMVETTEMLQEGYSVQVPQGERANLYFSDGSVSRLGSDTSATELTLLSASEQEKSALGTVTKVFLKLTEGRIFSKVLRLTQASEFNIQTTSSIAGVRGTEFGLEVKAGLQDSDRVYVYSGEVSVRKKTQEEMVQDAIIVSKASLDVPEWIVASDKTLIAADVLEVGLNPLDNQPFPSYETAVLLPQETQAFMEEFFSQAPLNNAIRPVLMGVQAPNSFTLKTLDELSEGLGGSLTPTHAYACQAEVAELCETQGICKVQQDCLSFVLPAPQDEVYEVLIGANLFGPLDAQDPSRFVFANLAGPDPQFSGFSLPAVFIDANTQLDEKDLEDYGAEVVLLDNEPKAENTPQMKCEQNGGYFFEGACWILGGPDQSCTTACQTFGEANDLPGLACDGGQWNDTQDCAICKDITGIPNINCDFIDADHSPFYRKIGQITTCRYNTNFASCDASDALVNRVCKCIP